MKTVKNRGQAALETVVLTAMVSLAVAAALGGLAEAVKEWIETMIVFVSLPVP